MKITGAEFMDWYDNHFPDGYYHESEGGIETHLADGSWTLDPLASYSTDDLGYLALDSTTTGYLSIEGQIKKYRRTRDFDLVMVRVPKAQTEDFKSILGAKGYKVER